MGKTFIPHSYCFFFCFEKMSGMWAAEQVKLSMPNKRTSHATTRQKKKAFEIAKSLEQENKPPS